MTSTLFYKEVGDEKEVFLAAARARLAVMIKGPTGVGKTRFIEAMAAELGRPLITVSCHEDLTSSDLIGRHLLEGGETVWIDGPLTRALREGAICYLDEIVEARSDAIVIIHALTDYRRQIHIDRLGETLSASDDFMLVVSFNPGYQSVLKDLKPSTRQRMVALELGFPPPEVEIEVLIHETGIDREFAEDLVRFGQVVREMDIPGLFEAPSTRVLVTAAQLTALGLPKGEAVKSAIIAPLSDDPDVITSLMTVAAEYLD